MVTESVSITATVDGALLISGYVGAGNSLFTFPGVPQVEATLIADKNNAVDYIVSCKGPIVPAKQDAIGYEVDSFGKFMMMIGALQPQQQQVSVWIGV